MGYRVRVAGSILRFLSVVGILFGSGWFLDNYSSSQLALLAGVLILFVSTLIEVAVLIICGEMNISSLVVYSLWDLFEIALMTTVIIDVIIILSFIYGDGVSISWRTIFQNILLFGYLFLRFMYVPRDPSS